MSLSAAIAYGIRMSAAALSGPRGGSCAPHHCRCCGRHHDLSPVLLPCIAAPAHRTAAGFVLTIAKDGEPKKKFASTAGSATHRLGENGNPPPPPCDLLRQSALGLHRSWLPIRWRRCCPRPRCRALSLREEARTRKRGRGSLDAQSERASRLAPCRISLSIFTAAMTHTERTQHTKTSATAQPQRHLPRAPLLSGPAPHLHGIPARGCRRPALSGRLKLVEIGLQRVILEHLEDSVLAHNRLGDITWRAHGDEERSKAAEVRAGRLWRGSDDGCEECKK